MKKNYTKKVCVTEEWHKLRGIGGSDASAILGKSKWGTPSDIYDRLVNGNIKHKPQNERMRIGTLAEEHIRKLYELYHKDYKIISPPKTKHWLFIRKDYPLITCTPDGIVKKQDGLYGLEIKDVELYKKEDKDAWESGILPEQYFYQVLHYMVTINDLNGVILVANLHYMKYDILTNKYILDYVVMKEYILKRKDCDKSIEYLENKEIDFINNNVKTKTRPKIIIKL